MPEIPDRVRNDKSEIRNEKVENSSNDKSEIRAEKIVRVKISKFTDSTAAIRGEKKFQIFGDDQNLGEYFFAKIVQTNDQIYFQNPVALFGKKFKKIRIVAADENETLQIENYENRPSWNLNLNDNAFFKTLEFRVFDEKMIAINELNLQNYLRGVAESPESDAAEKQKAMAILARSYAAFYLKSENRKFENAPFDLDDSPKTCQKFLGANFARRAPGWIFAVNSTENLVVKFNGELIKTPYFNSSAGMTKSAKTVWGWENTPYLQSVPDPCEAGILRGHGVGLSGCGAQKMASNGKKFDEIIKYFYRGVTIEKF